MEGGGGGEAGQGDIAETVVMEAGQEEGVDQEGEQEEVAMSKNQLRKLVRYERTVAKKKEQRKDEQKRQRERHKVQRQEGAPPKDQLRREQLERLEAAMVPGAAARVVVDLQFNHLMTTKELRHLANQLKRVYSSNKASLTPLHLHFVNLERDGGLYQLCCDQNEGFEKYIVTMEEQGLVELFPTSEVIYLSPDAEEVVESVEASKVYVIGGLVDDSVRKDTSRAFTRGAGLRCARLPIAEHMVRAEGGSYKQVLTVNQVFDILLGRASGQSWAAALAQHVPLKTGFAAKESL